MKRIKKILGTTLPGIFPLMVILLVVFIFFWRVFLRELLPIPTDFVVGIYYPWLDYIWEGYGAGVPVKNPLLADVPSLIYPLRAYAAEILHSGQIPLWNNLQFGGYPLLANFQSAVLYPLNFLYFLFATPDAWTLQVIFQPILASVFMYIFLRNLGLSKLPSLLGGFVYSFSGFNTIFLEYNVHGHVAAFIPLVLFLVDKYIKTSRAYFLVLLSVSIAFQIFAGYPQVTFYTLILTFIWTIFRLGLRKMYLEKRKVFLVCFFLALGVVLASPQVIPGLELLFLSQRSTEGAAGGINVAYLPWIKLVTLVAPDFFGNPSTYNYWGPGDYTTTVIYSGAIPLVLSVVAVTVLKDNAAVKFFLFLALATLLFATPNTVSFLIASSGFFGSNAALATRVFVIFNLSIAVLSAYGLNTLLRSKLGGVNFVRVFITIFLILLIVFIPFLVWYSDGGIKESFIFPHFPGMEFEKLVAARNLVFPALLLFSSLVLVFVATKYKKLRGPICLILLLLTVGELVRFGWKYTPFSKREFLYPTTPVFNFLFEKEKPFRISEGDVLPTSMWIPYKLESASGYDAVYPQHWSRFVSVVNSGNVQATGLGRVGRLEGYGSNLFDLMNIRYILALKQDEKGILSADGKVSGKFDLEKFVPVFEDKTVVVFENENALPRSFFVNNWEVKKEEEVLPVLVDSDFPLRSKIVLNQDFDLFEPQTSEELEYEIDYLEYGYQNYTITIDTATHGFLFVAEPWYPGWKVVVDSEPGKIYQADHSFMAVPVFAGTHTIEFIYDPISFRIGKWLSIATIIFLSTVFIYDKNIKNSRRTS